jgi:hypothetical protein
LSAVRTALINTRAEVVVHDNSDSPLPESLLRQIPNRERLIYKHTAAAFSVVDNFNAALKLANGEFLMFIGDDDSVGPDIDAIVDWASAHCIQSLVSYRNKFIANYFWPQVNSKYFGDKYAARLFVRASTGRTWRLDPARELTKALMTPGAGLGALPRIYHGIVHRDAVRAVEQSFGTLFGGVSPDIYSAVLLSSVVKTSYVVDHPFVLPGASPSSTAGEGAARTDVDDLNARDHIKRFGSNFRWDERIPAFYAPETVWAYSMLRALATVGRADVPFNFDYLYLRCSVSYPRHRGLINSAKKTLGRSFSHHFLRTIKAVYLEGVRNLSRVYFRFIDRPVVIASLNDVEAAYGALRGVVKPWPTPRVDHSSNDARTS